MTTPRKPTTERIVASHGIVAPPKLTTRKPRKGYYWTGTRHKRFSDRWKVHKPTANRAAAMRKAFVRRFGPMRVEDAAVRMTFNELQSTRLDAFTAGAAWQRRQRRPKP